MKNKQAKWLNNEMDAWQEAGLIDGSTAEKIKAYYEEKFCEEQGRLGPILGVIGIILIGLGIVSILARNWSYFDRLTKSVLSLLPFLIGSLGGMIVIKKNIGGWLKEAAALFTIIGILTAVLMNGQIYHVTTEEWVLVFTIAILSLPLVFLYQSAAALAAYLAISSTCLFMTDLTALGIKVGLGILLIGGGIPYAARCFKRSKQSIETIWVNIFLAVAGFAFVSSLGANGVLLRELYMIYFILLISLDELLYEKEMALSLKPFAAIGHLGLYITLFVLTFRGFWKYIDMQWTDWQYTVIIAVLLITVLLVTIQGIRVKKAFNIRLLICFGAIMVMVLFRLTGLTNSGFTDFLFIFFNLVFAVLAVSLLREGILKNSISVINAGLVLTAALIVARFFDSEISFLIKGIVFIICGLIFLLINYYLAKKRKKEIAHVEN